MPKKVSPKNWRLSFRDLLKNPSSDNALAGYSLPKASRLLSRERLFYLKKPTQLEFSVEEASNEMRRFEIIPIDICPFNYIGENIGGTDDVVKKGSFLSFKEVVSVIRTGTFYQPTYFPMMSHQRFENFKLVIVQVWDKEREKKRVVRSVFEDEDKDRNLFSDEIDGHIVLRPQHVPEKDTCWWEGEEGFPWLNTVL